MVVLLAIAYPITKSFIKSNKLTQEVSNYIMETREVDESVNDVIEKINNSYNKDLSYEEDEIRVDLGKIKELELTVETDNENFFALRDNYLELIDLTNNMLENISEGKHAYDGVEDMEEKLKENRDKKKVETIELLELYDIEYEEDSNGKLSYSIRKF